MVTSLFMGSAGYADETTDTPSSATVSTDTKTPSTGVATKGVAVNAAGVVVKLDKVSDPVLWVKASSTTTAPSVATTAYSAPTAGCMFADNPVVGELNRLIEVTVAAGESGNVYGELTYSTTDVTTGVTTTQSVQPFGAGGLDVAAPSTSMTVPVSICVG